MCNSRPLESSSRCHLLGYGRLVTLFHGKHTCLVYPTARFRPLGSHNRADTTTAEFGHAFHDLLSRTTYAHFHGYEAVKEFVETIGMTFEQLCWLRDELKVMSRHYTRVDPS
jgi:Zn-dependent oligopeptidase